MAVPRSRLLDILQGAAAPGAGGSPVGTDALPTGALEQASATPPPNSPLGEEEVGGEQSVLGGPDMTPDERAKLQAELALAARQRLLGMK